MERHRRNHAVAAITMIVGGCLALFGATQAWVTGAAAVPWPPIANLSPNGSLGFDTLLLSDRGYGDVTPLLFGATGLLGAAALLLLITRVRGLGLLWRMVGLGAVAVLGFICLLSWRVVQDPMSVVPGEESVLGDVLDAGFSLAQSAGLVQVRPGLGLWLLTIGCGVAAIGVLIPAFRYRLPPPAAAAASNAALTESRPGWYPDQSGGEVLRWFDGNRWTSDTRPWQ